MRLLKKVGVDGSERPAGASRATDVDSAPEARSGLAKASSTHSSTVSRTGRLPMKRDNERSRWQFVSKFSTVP